MEAALGRVVGPEYNCQPAEYVLQTVRSLALAGLSFRSEELNLGIEINHSSHDRFASLGRYQHRQLAPR